MTELENYANERTKFAHELRSLDILSLTNLATAAQEHGSVHRTNGNFLIKNWFALDNFYFFISCSMILSFGSILNLVFHLMLFILPFVLCCFLVGYLEKHP